MGTVLGLILPTCNDKITTFSTLVTNILLKSDILKKILTIQNLGGRSWKKLSEDAGNGEDILPKLCGPYSSLLWTSAACESGDEKDDLKCRLVRYLIAATAKDCSILISINPAPAEEAADEDDTTARDSE